MWTATGLIMILGGCYLCGKAIAKGGHATISAGMFLLTFGFVALTMADPN